MNPETPLWRQIRPTPKDQNRLSFDEGGLIAAEQAWRRYTEERGLQSVGVLGVLVGECVGEGLRVIPDGVPDPEHGSVDFTGNSNGERKSIAKRLRDHALGRGWQFGPVEVSP
ncbi:MAG: hypothetical protein RLZZ117_193 [Cyanobacteriota bacterium]